MEQLNFINIKFISGSVTNARVKVCGTQDAQSLQDIAAERCSMPYRAPELFNVESYCMVDERTDIWVSFILRKKKIIFVILPISLFVFIIYSHLDVFYTRCVTSNHHLMQFMNEETV